MSTRCLRWFLGAILLTNVCQGQAKPPATGGWKPALLLTDKTIHPSQLALAGNKVFFLVNEDHFHERAGRYQTTHLCVSDGTPAGTRTLRRVSDGSNPYEKAITAFGKLVLFSVAGPNGADTLYRSDGTPAGTFALTSESGKAIGYPRQLLVVGNKAYLAQMADQWCPSPNLWREFKTTVWETDGLPRHTKEASFKAWSISLMNGKIVTQPQMNSREAMTIDQDGVARPIVTPGWTQFVPSIQVGNQWFGFGLPENSDQPETVVPQASALWQQATDFWRTQQRTRTNHNPQQVDNYDPTTQFATYLGVQKNATTTPPLLTWPVMVNPPLIVTSSQQLAVVFPNGLAIQTDGTVANTHPCRGLMTLGTSEPCGFKNSIYFFRLNEAQQTGGLARFGKGTSRQVKGLYRLTESGDAQLVDSTLQATPTVQPANNWFYWQNPSRTVPVLTATANALYFQQGNYLIRWQGPGQLEKLPLPFETLLPFRHADYSPNETTAVLEWARGLLIMGEQKETGRRLLYAINRTIP
ncbi:hypothetical protein ACAW74_13020 [Fibrella sp. WM1]|uniref:hypothetical protein n=1 Tax=Fibrella musci TaxID=3242485 RepID=UPI0035207848